MLWLVVSLGMFHVKHGGLLGWLLWFCGLGSRCLNGWMSGLVMFEDGWCFTWNVGLVGTQCGSGFT